MTVLQTYGWWRLHAVLVTDQGKEIGVRLFDVQGQLTNCVRPVNESPHAHTASDSRHLFPWKSHPWAG